MNEKINKFMSLYIALLYKYGYCYFDVSKDNLDEYLKQLKLNIEYNNILDKDQLDELLKYNENNYDNFINYILIATKNLSNSFFCEKSNIIMVNYNELELDKIINNCNNEYLKSVQKVVEQMSFYLNLELKIKVLKNKQYML